MGGLIDRYLAKGVALRFLLVLGIVIAMLSLENVARLAADVERSNAPLALLGKLTMALVPEHLSAAIPIALMVAIALSVRQMALRGEWQILSAAGMSRARRMAAPALMATLAATLLLGDRLEWRPAGERSLDAIYLALQSGDYGVPIPLGEAVPLDAHTTLFASGSDDQGHLTGVMVKRDGQTFSAPLATVSHGRNGVVLTLSDGVSIARLDNGSIERAEFSTIRLGGTPPMIGMVGNDFRHRLDRLSAGSLWELAASGDGETARAATTALVIRADAALFCLFIPWIAMILGVPARRHNGAAGLAVAVLLVAAHLQSAVFIEDNFAGNILVGELIHLGGWALVALGLVRLEVRHGEGFIDPVVARAARRIASIRLPRLPVIGQARPARDWAPAAA